jgi:lon-related putative ATP-dependent protease
LRRSADEHAYAFETTAELEPLERLVGQERALDALAFGIAIDAPGFNVYMLGEEGTGRRTAALEMLRSRARGEAGPSDWCYINDFDDPRRPRALALPAGTARPLAAELEGIVTRLATELPKVLGSEEYQAQRKMLLDRLESLRKRLFERAEEEAERKSLAVVRGPQVIVIVPKRNGELLSEEELARLPPEERHRYDEARSEVQALFEEALRRFGEAATETQEAVRELNRRTVEATVSSLLRGVRGRYGHLSQLASFLDAMERDLAEVIHKVTILSEIDEDILARTLASEEFQRRYMVNVLVAHDGNGAPVVEEPNPTYANLIGRIEHRVLQGVLTTDFTMIRAGALLRANGGYLLVDALEVLRRPLAWEALKRVLKQGEVKVEEPAAELGIISTVSLEPEPIPLRLKVVLLGSPLFYYLLSSLDPDFAQIFKVKSDFGPTIPRTPETEREYARFVEGARRSESLPVFEASAVAALVEFGSRQAGDQTRLTARLAEIGDLVREAGFRARQGGRERVGRAEVREAILSRRRRLDRLEEELHREIEAGILLFSTRGEAIARANGLSVLMPGDYAFAKPIRVSASVSMGVRGVIDIERESTLGGPIHSKAVLILGGYLHQRYGKEQPVVLTASLTFEQSYEKIEGDSATLAELLTLLSALSSLPLRQDLAITGSVNQAGEVQPVGGVTEKVEGFYHACRIQGFTGTQGVILPATNVRHLMLDPEVVEAAGAGRFAIYPVESVDQAIALAFARPPEEVHAAVQAELKRYLEGWRALGVTQPLTSPPSETAPHPKPPGG